MKCQVGSTDDKICKISQGEDTIRINITQHLLRAVECLQCAKYSMWKTSVNSHRNLVDVIFIPILHMTKMGLRKVKELLRNFNISVHILEPKLLARHCFATMGGL